MTKLCNAGIVSKYSETNWKENALQHLPLQKQTVYDIEGTQCSGTLLAVLSKRTSMFYLFWCEKHFNLVHIEKQITDKNSLCFTLSSSSLIYSKPLGQASPL